MNPMRIFYTVCAAWVAAEVILLLVKRSRRDDVSRRDQGSVWIIWMAVSISAFAGGMLTAVRSARMPSALIPYAFWTGLALIVAGFLIRIVAMMTLRRYFTVDVAIAKDHKVIDTGLYAIVRHPAYFGSFVSFLGLGLAFVNWLSLAVMLTVPGLAIAHRMRIEERALVDALGDQYRAYALRTKRLIPGVF
jgi:protein-S-isoprenylcysteine O-methyltransferase Ste14